MPESEVEAAAERALSSSEDREALRGALESSRKLEPQSLEELLPGPAAAHSSVTEGVRMLARRPPGLTQFTVQGRPLTLAVRDGLKGAPAGARRRR